MRDERDLIQRVRHMAKLLGVGSYDIPALLNEAANEIERLRSVTDALPTTKKTL